MSDLFKTKNRKNSDSIKWKLAKEQCKTEDCLTFSIADSDYESALEIKQALVKRSDHGAYGYTSVGDDYLSIVRDWFKRRYLTDIEEKWIVPIPTVLNGLSVCISLFTNNKEKVVIQTPVYHVFKPVIESNNRVVLDNKMIIEDKMYKMNLAELEGYFKSGVKTFILCSPHNPVGRVWTKKELSDLIKLCSKYQVLIISDEIHADIIMPNKEFISLAKFFNEYDNIIILSAPTKTFNIAGLQIANIISGRKQLTDQIKTEYQRLHLSTPNLMALAAIKAAYQKGEDWVDKQNNHIYNNYMFMKQYFSENSDIEVFPLEGTYLAWIKLNNYNSTWFVNELCKKGVVLSDGLKFDEEENFIRFNLACSREQLTSGLKIIKKFMSENASDL